MATLAGHEDLVNACAFSPDGRRIVSASEDSTLRLWDAESGADITLTFWDAENGPNGLYGHSQAVTACVFSPDGRQIVSLSRDWALRVWDAETGEGRGRLARRWPSVTACAFSPDGRRIVSVYDDKTLALVDAETGHTRVTLIGHQDVVNACAFSPDGRLIVSASDDKTLKLWDIETAPEEVKFCGHRGPVGACAFSPDGRRIVSGGGGARTELLDSDRDQRSGELKLWDAETGQELYSLTAHRSLVSACAFSPNGRQIVSASHDGTLKLWDAETRQLQAELMGHFREVSACAFAPDGRRLVSASWDGTLKLWDAEVSEKRKAVSMPPSMNVETIGLAAIQIRQYIEKAGVLKLARATLRAVGDGFPLWSCSFSPDGRRIISASVDGTLTLWDAERRRRLAQLMGHPKPVTACAFSPDGRRILSASHDATLKLWDADRRCELASLRGHQKAVNACGFSPDDRWIVSGSEDETLRIWDAQTYAMRCEFVAGSVMAVACGHRGHIVIGTDAGEILLLRAENLHRGPAVVTAWQRVWRRWRFWRRPARSVHVGCPMCHDWSEAAAKVLGKEINCPNCGERLKLNPFSIDADWRPIARAWRESDR